MPKPIAESEEGASQRVAFGTAVAGYDEDLYERDGPLKSRPGYVTSIDPNVAAGQDGNDNANENDQLERSLLQARKNSLMNITAPQHFIAEAENAAASRHSDDPFKPYAPKTIAESDNSYLAKARKAGLYSRDETQSNAEKVTVKSNSQHSVETSHLDQSRTGNASSTESKGRPRSKRRWDVIASETASEPSKREHVISDITSAAVPVDDAQPPPLHSPQDAVPKPSKTARWDDPVASGTNASTSAGISSHSRWDATPASSVARRSRWDKTPILESGAIVHRTPVVLSTGGNASATSFLQDGLVTSDVANATTLWQVELEKRNKPWTDDELNELLPSDGYVILEQPPGYKPVKNPARLLLNTPIVSAVPQTPLYALPTEGGLSKDALGIPVDIPQSLKGISMKPEDYKNFAAVLDKNTKDEDVSEAEQVERKIMRLLLKIKNGAPSIRKYAMRQITERAREFGAGPLLDQILTLLKSPTLEHQERHLYVKVVDRVLYKLDDLVRPHVRDILVVIEPMLIDEDFYARVEGREIISNLSKVVGLATMISTMRPDIDHKDEFVRNTTARALAVVTSALGIPSMLMFLRAVCGSKKSWEARHTGIKIVQQIAMLMGVAVLPHLKELVEIVQAGLTDEQGKVRLIAAFAIAGLAEASAPYGIESFDDVLKPLWDGIRLHRGMTLAAFLKAIGFIIPLMDAEYANYYAREVNHILIREFKSPDDDMKSVVLKVVTQCVSCSGVDANYVREEVAPEYFRCFWIRRMALDRRNFKAVVDTTLTIAKKIGGAYVIGRLVDDLKDPSDPYRRMVVETVEKITESLGLSDVDASLEARLVDGLMYAFQEQQGTVQDSCSALCALSVVIEKLGIRAKPYLERIIGVMKWRLNNKNTKTREQAADLISRIAPVLKACEENELISHMSTVLFEYLGEEFPDVLGSILKAMKSIVEVIGIDDMQPPINELLPRLTPILKNRHEKVQENCIVLVGKIAYKGARYVSPKEWMRICFELLELLKAPRKAIRKSAVATFGYIAKAIGPGNVLVPLLNNLKVQERTQRVCTTVAIAIVAETCKPYTILPALMNEYRIPELHVQNGILKSLSFLFEYIGPMAGDYIYAVTPILEDALIDRDLVHRQTACSAVGHLALGVRGLGVEDALIHLLNHVWPNIFETSPHVINAVMSAIQGCAVALGPAPMLLYLLHGLFHPAKKVREVYWRIYNSLYIYAQDALVPSYPPMTTVDLDGESDNEYGDDRYERHELFVML